MLGPPFIRDRITRIRETEAVPFQNETYRLIKMDGRQGSDLYAILVVDDFINPFPVKLIHFEFKPASNIQLSFAPRFRTEWGISRWLGYTEDEAEERDQEIFGEQESTRLDMTVRGTVTFTRDISLQVYAQPLNGYAKSF